MSSENHIAIDVMGGDFGPRFCVPATLKFLQANPKSSVSVVGQPALIAPLLASAREDLRKRIRMVEAEQVVESHERPGVAYRHKRQSSMWRALEILASGEADACVSAGNTGALMAMSRHLIGTVEGMSRPAICKSMPNVNGDSLLLDMGANLDCSPLLLQQFALMGTALARVNGCENPQVALLNVGAETTKGNQEIQQAYSLFEAHEAINFYGFIEGNHLYDGRVDVIVCDGFIGNVALKVSEGAASFILNSLKQEFSSSILRRCVGAINYMVLRRWRERFNPAKYNGAALLGLKKTVVKSHGGAEEEGFLYALQAAKQQVDTNTPEQLEKFLFSGALPQSGSENKSRAATLA